MTSTVIMGGVLWRAWTASKAHGGAFSISAPTHPTDSLKRVIMSDPKDSSSSSSSKKVEHLPVLLQEILEASETDPSPKKSFDGTFGRGGHARALFQKFPQLNMVGFDWDEEAEKQAQKAFNEEIQSQRLVFFRNTYHDFAQLRQQHPQLLSGFDFMLLDLGVSSPQLDQSERGFSFYHNGPLDMRMDQRRELTAADIVNNYSEMELLKLFQEYGEIPRPMRVIKAIAHDRKTALFQDTHSLAGLIERVDGWQKKGSHPATRYFLALRMAVNDELKLLEQSLRDLVDGLSPTGRLAVITFHSLEDRLTKQTFRDLEGPIGYCLNKKVIVPQEEELKANARSRSAKLRVFQRGEKPDKYELKKQRRFQEGIRGQKNDQGSSDR